MEYGHLLAYSIPSLEQEYISVIIGMFPNTPVTAPESPSKNGLKINQQIISISMIFDGPIIIPAISIDHPIAFDKIEIKSDYLIQKYKALLSSYIIVNVLSNIKICKHD